MAADAN